MSINVLLKYPSPQLTAAPPLCSCPLFACLLLPQIFTLAPHDLLSPPVYILPGMHDSQDAALAEGDTPDGSDKPPHDGSPAKRPKSRRNSFLAKLGLSRVSSVDDRAGTPTRADSKQSSQAHLPASPPNSIPLPPPESGAFPKEPGYTKGELGHYVMQQQAATNLYQGAQTPSSESPEEESLSDDDSWPPSVPSTRPQSRTNSRAPSFSNGKVDPEVDARAGRPPLLSTKSPDKLTKAEDLQKLRASTPSDDKPSVVSSSTPTPQPAQSKTTSRPASRASSVHSDSGHKFQLRDLIAGTPKLNRKSSARSTASSKKSDSDGDRRSTAGDSTTSLSKKYGVCERLAIGKGATSVVRLAHKWDRDDEKLYAVKVRQLTPENFIRLNLGRH